MAKNSKKFKLQNEKFRQELIEFNKNSIEEIQKIIEEKMESEEFADFLYYYANEYGRTCTKQEIKKYIKDNRFIENILYVHGYFITEWHGQGVFMQIVKE